MVGRRSEETPAFVAGDVGAIGCVQADARLDRVRAFVKVQDGCSFSCNFCVIPLVRGASRSRRADAVLAEAPARRAGPSRGRPDRDQPRLLPRPRGRYDLPRLVREVGATPGLRRLRLSSIEVNHVDDELVRALRETPTVSGTCTCRCSRATTAFFARWVGATRLRPTSAGSSRSATST